MTATGLVSQIPGAVPDQYRVASRSKPGTYHVVRFRGSGDADPDYVRLWECDCPAHKFRGDLCVHIRAVIDFVDREDLAP